MSHWGSRGELPVLPPARRLPRLVRMPGAEAARTALPCAESGRLRARASAPARDAPRACAVRQRHVGFCSGQTATCSEFVGCTPREETVTMPAVLRQPPRPGPAAGTAAAPFPPLLITMTCP